MKLSIYNVNRQIYFIHYTNTNAILNRNRTHIIDLLALLCAYDYRVIFRSFAAIASSQWILPDLNTELSAVHTAEPNNNHVTADSNDVNINSNLLLFY